MEKITPYDGKEPYIFISYAHKNNDLVMPVIKRLVADGYRVWYDEGIVPGSEWDNDIAVHLEGCGMLLAMMSPEYMASGNCRDELNYARDLDKPQLLAYLSPVELPSGMRMRLGRLQAVFKYSYEIEDDFYKKIYAAECMIPCRAEAEETPAAPDTAELFQKGKAAFDAGDAAEAFKCFRIAALGGDADAMYYLGRCYKKAIGAVEDVEEAFNWYRKAADLGLADAAREIVLGTEWEYHRFGAIDLDLAPEEIAGYCRIAAEQGDDDCQYFMGLLYFMGYGVPENEDVGRQWMTLSAEQDNKLAAHDLGLYLYDKKKISEAIRWLDVVVAQADEAAETLDLIDETGEAAETLGLIYETGEGVEKDLRRAYESYQKGARIYDTEDLRCAYDRYPAGGVSYPIKIERLWRRTGVAAYLLGEYERAFHYLKGASGAESRYDGAGDHRAQYYLARCYEEGKGTPPDRAEAIKWYTRAATRANVEAVSALQRMGAPVPVLTASEHCNNGSAFYYGSHGEEKNYAEAVKHCQMAAKMGNGYAAYLVGRCYHLGGHGLKKDLFAAKRWYKISARLGSSYGKDALQKWK